MSWPPAGKEMLCGQMSKLQELRFAMTELTVSVVPLVLTIRIAPLSKLQLDDGEHAS
jgi:hypothetical protein